MVTRYPVTFTQVILGSSFIANSAVWTKMDESMPDGSNKKNNVFNAVNPDVSGGNNFKSDDPVDARGACIKPQYKEALGLQPEAFTEVALNDLA